jgi:hypothetical protein
VGLREVAEADLAFILEDADTGFGWPITITNPAGLESTDLIGFSNDVAQLIDPDTGQAVTGRTVSVAIRISTLIAQGFDPVDLPKNVVDGPGWIVTFDDINSNAYTFRVINGNPDRALGMITCELTFNG